MTLTPFKILLFLGSSEKSASDIKEYLKNIGLKRSDPAFYQMTKRMRRDGLVSEHKKLVGNSAISYYKATPKGKEAIKELQS
jgi:DNA-binding PadR family transcriptional regulator